MAFRRVIGGRWRVVDLHVAFYIVTELCRVDDARRIGDCVAGSAVHVPVHYTIDSGFLPVALSFAGRHDRVCFLARMDALFECLRERFSVTHDMHRAVGHDRPQSGFQACDAFEIDLSRDGAKRRADHYETKGELADKTA